MILSSKGLKTLELTFSKLSDENFGKIKRIWVPGPESRVFYVGSRVSGLTESVSLVSLGFTITPQKKQKTNLWENVCDDTRLRV